MHKLKGNHNDLTAAWRRLGSLASFLFVIQAAPCFGTIICKSLSAGGQGYLVVGTGEWWTYSDDCDETGTHGGALLAGTDMTGDFDRVAIHNDTLGGVITWTIEDRNQKKDEEVLTIRPGETAYVTVPGSPAHHRYAVAFPSGLPGPGEFISIVAEEEILPSPGAPLRTPRAPLAPGSQPLYQPLHGFVLDLGGSISPQPSSVSFIYVDDGGSPVNVNMLSQCGDAIDVNDLKGRIATLPGHMPPTTLAFGQIHTTLGQARLKHSGRRLKVENLGSSGQDGVRVRLGNSDGSCLVFGEIGKDKPLPDGASLSLAMQATEFGVFDTVLATLTARQEPGDTIAFDLAQGLAYERFTVEAYFEDVLLASAFTQGPHVAYAAKWPYWMESRVKKECRPFHHRAHSGGASGEPGDIWIGFGPLDEDGSGVTEVTMPFGGTVYANLLRIVPDNMFPSFVTALPRVDVTTTGMSDLTISDEMLYAFALMHATVNDGRLLAGDGTLEFAPAKEGKASGAHAEFCPADRFDMTLGAIDPLGSAPAKAYLRASAVGSLNGRPDQDLGTLTITQTDVPAPGGAPGDRELVVTANFKPIRSKTHRVQVLNGGALVADIPGHRGNAAKVTRWPIGLGKLFSGLDPDRTKCFVGDWPPDSAFEIDGATYVGDELRVLAENDVDQLDFLSSFGLESSDLPGVAITGESLLPAN